MASRDRDLRSSLLPDSDNDEENQLSSSDEEDDEHKECIKPEWRSTICGGLIVLAVALLMVGTAAVIMFWSGPAGMAPTCRKGGVMAVLNNTNIFVWSGEGKGGIQDGTPWKFDVKERVWSKWLQADGEGAPPSRWKAVADTIPGGGLVMFGGDTNMKTEPFKGYLNDLWIERPLQKHPAANSAYKWDLINVTVDDLPLPSKGPDLNALPTDTPLQKHAQASNGLTLGPQQRRAHAGATLTTRSGEQYFYIYGGRTADSGILTDVWRVRLDTESPHWELEWSGEEDAPQPLPRKGHSMVMANTAQKPHHPVLIVYGGRNDTTYHGDVWAFDPLQKEWTLLHDGSSPQGSSDEAPIPRDHHVAVVRDAEMVVHAGRSGSDHDESVPLADLWVFNVHLAKWTQIKLDANDPAPTSRFLHMGALSQDRTRMYVFGGQHTTDATMDADPTTEKAVRYNDVWALNLVTRRWDSLFETRCS